MPSSPEYQRQWRQAHPDYNRQWRAKNADKVNGYYKQWAAKNRARLTEYRVFQRVGYAAPPWVDRQALLDAYADAQEFKDAGFTIHVDHIVPLNHPQVCGLHVPWNLRISTGEGNLKKGGQFPSWFHGEEQLKPAFKG